MQPVTYSQYGAWTGAVRIAVMRYRLSTLALVVLLTSVVLSGVVNHTLSLMAVIFGIVTWIAAVKAGGYATIIGLIGVSGWLLIAAVIATAFRQP